MGKSKLDRKEISMQFLNGRNCAQCVLGAYAEDLGYDGDETDKMARCFGGGMGMGHTCGAVTGALMAIGLGADDPAAAAQQFKDEFTKQHGTCLCAQLLDCDFSDPESVAAVRASGKMQTECPGFVEDALAILDDILGD